MEEKDKLDNSKKEDIIKNYERSYQQMQLISTIMITVTTIILAKSGIDSHINVPVLKISYILIFLVLTINLFTVLIISHHISKIYNLISGSKKNFNKKVQSENIEKAYAYHWNNFHKLHILNHIFRISLLIFYLSIVIVFFYRDNFSFHLKLLILLIITIFIGIFYLLF